MADIRLQQIVLAHHRRGEDHVDALMIVDRECDSSGGRARRARGARVCIVGRGAKRAERFIQSLIGLHAQRSERL